MLLGRPVFIACGITFHRTGYIPGTLVTFAPGPNPAITCSAGSIGSESVAESSFRSMLPPGLVSSLSAEHRLRGLAACDAVGESGPMSMMPGAGRHTFRRDQGRMDEG